MAHIFDGNWRSFIVINGTKFTDKKIKIKVNPRGNTLEPDSTHGDEPVTGKATDGPDFHAITINKGSNQFKGVLTEHDDGTLSICGFLDLDASFLASLRKEAGWTDDGSDKRATLTTGQEQEVWVATKP